MSRSSLVTISSSTTSARRRRSRPTRSTTRPNASGVIRIDLTTTFARCRRARPSSPASWRWGRAELAGAAFKSVRVHGSCTVTLTPTGYVGWSRRQHRERERIHRGGLCLDGGECRLGHHLERRRRDREWTVNYSIAANTAPTARNAALTIGGQTFNISGCRLHLHDLSEQLSVTSDARDRDRFCDRGHRVRLDAASSASWITVTSGASGSGNGSVGYSIAANTTISSRAGIVTIAGQAFTVTQAGMLCTATISPTGVSVAAASATGNIAVSVPAGCVWTAVDDASWVSITSGASGNGNGTVAYSIAANPNTTQRTATIAIGGQFFGITQAGSVCSTTISPTASSPTAAGGSERWR